VGPNRGDIFSREIFESIFADGPSRYGAVVKFDRESVHHTYYANYGEDDKGFRVSWDEHADGSISNVHYKNQNTGKPSSWFLTIKQGGCFT